MTVFEIFEMVWLGFDADDANALGRVVSTPTYEFTSPDNWLCEPILGHYTGKTPAQTEWWVG